MSIWDQAVAHFVKVLLLAALWGVLARRLYRVSFAFPTYLVAVLSLNGLMTIWPDRFWTRSFFLSSEAAWDAAELALALELSYRAFRAFPRARAVARVVIFAVLAATTLAIADASAPGPGSGPMFQRVMLQWHPRLIVGLVWLLAGTSVLVLWYRLPIHPFQRVVLLGLGSYRLVVASLLNVMSAHGWGVRMHVNLVDGLAYAVVATYWAYSAWTCVDTAAVSPALIRRLQLERA